MSLTPNFMTQTFGVWIYGDGKRILVFGKESSVNRIVMFDLSTAWDPTTMTLNGNKFSPALAPNDIQGKEDGTKFWIRDNTGADSIVEYTMGSTGTVNLDSGLSGSVDTIKVNGVDIMSGAVNFNTDLATTATDVASNITAHTSTPDYNAAAVGTLITITPVTQPDTGSVVSTSTIIVTTDTNMDFDLSLAVVTTNKFDLTQSVFTSGVDRWYVSEDGKFLVIWAERNGTIFQYPLSTDYDISTTGTAVVIPMIGHTPFQQTVILRELVQNLDGTRLTTFGRWAGPQDDIVAQYDIAIPYAGTGFAAVS